MTGIPFGIAMAQFNLNQFSRMMEPLRIGKSGFSFLIQRNGLLVATSTLTPVVDSHLVRVNTLESCNHTGIYLAVHAIVKVLFLAKSS